MSETNFSAVGPQEIIKRYLNVPPHEEQLDAVVLREWACALRDAQPVEMVAPHGKKVAPGKKPPYESLLAAHMFYELAAGSSELPYLLQSQKLATDARINAPRSNGLLKARAIALHTDSGLRLGLLPNAQPNKNPFDAYKQGLLLAARTALHSRQELDGSDMTFLNRLTGSLLLTETREYIGLSTAERLSANLGHSAAAWNMRLWNRAAGTQTRVRVGSQPGPSSLLLPPAALLHTEYDAAATPFGTLEALVTATERSERRSAPAKAHVQAARLAVVSCLEQPRNVVEEVATPDNYEDWYAHLPPRNPYRLFRSRLEHTGAALQTKVASGEITYEGNMALGWVRTEQAGHVAATDVKQALAYYKQAADVFHGIVLNTKPDELLHYQARLGIHAASTHSAILEFGREGVFKPKPQAEAWAATAKMFIQHLDKLNPTNSSEAQVEIDRMLQTLTLGLITSGDATESCVIIPAPPRQHAVNQGGWHLHALPMNHSSMFKAGFATNIRLSETPTKTSKAVQAVSEGVVNLTMTELIREATPKGKEPLSTTELLRLAICRVNQLEKLKPEDITLLDAIHGKCIDYTQFAGML